MKSIFFWPLFAILVALAIAGDAAKPGHKPVVKKPVAAKPIVRTGQPYRILIRIGRPYYKEEWSRDLRVSRLAHGLAGR